MTQLYVWPPTPPDALDKLYEETAHAIGAGQPVVLDRLQDFGDRRAGATGPAALLVVLHGQDDAAGATIEALARLADQPALALVAVVSDGWLGTDGPDIASASDAGAVVAIVRSLAVRRDGGVRANVVCAAESLFGPTGSQRGPLRQSADATDVGEAVRFLLGDEASYLSGQVLFVNSGRHLFSSMTA